MLLRDSVDDKPAPNSWFRRVGWDVIDLKVTASPVSSIRYSLSFHQVCNTVVQYSLCYHYRVLRSNYFTVQVYLRKFEPEQKTPLDPLQIGDTGLEPQPAISATPSGATIVHHSSRYPTPPTPRIIDESTKNAILPHTWCRYFRFRAAAEVQE